MTRRPELTWNSNLIPILGNVRMALFVESRLQLLNFGLVCEVNGDSSAVEELLAVFEELIDLIPAKFDFVWLFGMLFLVRQSHKRPRIFDVVFLVSLLKCFALQVSLLSSK